MKMKHVVASAVALASLAGLASCQSDVLQIGILQFVTHDALDAAKDGFVQALEDAGFVDGENIEITVSNPQTDPTIMASGAAQLARKSDLILAIATPAAISAKSAIEDAGKETPLLFTAVTDPVASGLIASPELPGGFVTGTNDMNPVADQIALFEEFPGIEKIGLLYSSAESNSVIQINLAKAKCEALGLAFVDQPLTGDEATIQSTINQLFANESIDGVYIPTDNYLASAMTSVSSKAIEKGLPLIVGEAGQVTNGGFLTLGLSYFTLGETTGEMAVQILKDGVEPKDIPSTGASSFPLVVSQVFATAAGITIPQSILDRADTIITESSESSAVSLSLVDVDFLKKASVASR